MGAFLDIARSGYVGLPAGVRRYIGAALGAVPVELRFGGAYRDCRTKIALARCDHVMAREEQRARLERLVAVALEKSLWYRQVFTQTFGQGTVAEEIIRPENWRRVPVLDNPTVRREGARLCCAPADTLDRVTTGGSSGKPLPFYLDRDRSPTEYAFIMDLWDRAGCGPDEWRASFRGWNIDAASRQPFEVEHGLRQLRLSVFRMQPDDMARYAGEIARRGIRFLQGYPHAIAKFAAFVARHDLPMRHDIAAVMLHSEPLYPEYSSTIEQAFPNAKLLPFYGLSEKCAFGSPVPDRPGVYEMNPLYGLTELLDDDDAPVTEPGRRGRLVSTGLQFMGMPFIRYETGDRATLIELPEEANGHCLRVADIVPREGHLFLVTRSNQFIPAHTMMMGDHEVDAISEFQYEQHRAGEVKMRLVPAEGAQASTIEAYIRKANERLGGELVLIPEIVSAIPLTSRGKLRIVIQHLDVSRSDDHGPLPAITNGAADV
ncbi:phenylacetate--CoA ligase family protein [Aliihoeflea sp. PC F10.4]